jgi:catechol 2,3-dioxygenase-like lactoylglutathione lyase family enzyme
MLNPKEYLPMPDQTPTDAVLELRVALTSAAFERLLAMYTIGLGLEPSELWTNNGDRAALLAMGRATIEIFDEAHAALVDELEVGARVSGPIRLALEVPDVDAALARVLAHGATLVHPPVITPWHHKNARVQDPDGLQITLFQVLEPAADAPADSPDAR